jgi:hypothetical protein
MKAIKIPVDLTAEEALCINALLEQITSALWALHGDAMLERLDRHRRLAAAEPRCPVCQPDSGDDDLPF